jgi:hypothetical protein
MLKLIASNDEILVRPRWPARSVFVTEISYEQLKRAQRELLPHELRIVLTRGYENEGGFLKFVRRITRRTGGWLFCIVYPKRAHERDVIFCPNGHDKSGDCVDVSVMYENKILNFLPLGVFTSERLLSSLRYANEDILKLVWSKLEAAGFTIHSNTTEAMQIHCELTSMAISRQ